MSEHRWKDLVCTVCGSRAYGPTRFNDCLKPQPQAQSEPLDESSKTTSSIYQPSSSEQDDVKPQSFNTYWARRHHTCRVWEQKSEENQHLHTWLTALKNSQEQIAKLTAERDSIATSFKNLHERLHSERHAASRNYQTITDKLKAQVDEYEQALKFYTEINYSVRSTSYFFRFEYVSPSAFEDAGKTARNVLNKYRKG